MNILWWVVVQSMMISIVVAGLFYGVLAALNIIIFMTWIFFLIYGLLLMVDFDKNKDIFDKGFKNMKRKVPKSVTNVTFWIMPLLFAGAGWFWYAIMWLIIEVSNVKLHNYVDKIDKEKINE